MEDAALSAFGVFFTQTPSFLAYQRKMADSKGKSNAQSLFGVHQITSDNHIRDLLDGVSHEQVFPMFEKILQGLEDQGQLSSFRCLGERLLVALDGTEYFSSTHSPSCRGLLGPTKPINSPIIPWCKSCCARGNHLEL